MLIMERGSSPGELILSTQLTNSNQPEAIPTKTHGTQEPEVTPERKSIKTAGDSRRIRHRGLGQLPLGARWDQIAVDNDI